MYTGTEVLSQIFAYKTIGYKRSKMNPNEIGKDTPIPVRTDGRETCKGELRV
jgi:hypothetical protein